VVYVRLILCTTLADLEELSINLLPVLRAVQTQQTENGGVDESDDSYAAVTTRPGVIGRPSVKPDCNTGTRGLRSHWPYSEEILNSLHNTLPLITCSKAVSQKKTIVFAITLSNFHKVENFRQTDSTKDKFTDVQHWITRDKNILAQFFETLCTVRHRFVCVNNLWGVFLCTPEW